MKLKRQNDPKLPNIDIDKKKKPKFFNKKFHFILNVFFYYFRRIILGFTVIYLKTNLIWQLYSIAFQYVAKLIMLGYRPLRTRFANNWEFFNEVTIMIVMYHMICFSDAVGNI